MVRPIPLLASQHIFKPFTWLIYNMGIGKDTAVAKHPKCFLYASETWKSERSYKPFSVRLTFLRGFDPLRWYQIWMCRKTGNPRRL